MSTVDDKKFHFTKAIDHLKEELKQVRTGRANSALVENLTVEYYGTPTPLLQLAAISVPDSRSVLIQPWDKNSLRDIERAIQTSPLGLNPINEGNALRLPVPSLTEERRRELTKVVHGMVEQARVSVRSTREEIWRKVKDDKTNGTISEDEMFALQKELQKIVDATNETIKTIGEEKERDIMTI